MSQVLGESLVDAGRMAFARHAWHEAYDFLSRASESQVLEADDLDALADSAWWTGQLEASMAARERAYARFLDNNQKAEAARCAVSLSMDHIGKLNHSLAAGWLGRAERLLENEPEGPAHGSLALIKAFMAFHNGHYDAAMEFAHKLVDIGTRFADRDLQAFGLTFEGRILVAQGDVDRGLALLDEATVAAVSGELGPLATGVVYCMAISSTTFLRDYRRAGEWTEAAKRWCERQSISGFPGVCRVHRAQIMHLRGAWSEAEQDVRIALKELKDWNLENAGEAFYELGEIRLRVGDLQAAEQAFRQAEELGKEPQPGRSLLQLVEGKLSAAQVGIRRALAEEARGPLHRFTLLGPQVEIAIAAGDLQTAETAAASLEEIVEAYRTPALQAGSAYARGLVHLFRKEPEAALEHLWRAIRLWKEADVPYEAARTRLAIAQAYQIQGDEESASLELEAAHSAFERLGAELDLRRTRELMGKSASGNKRAPRIEKTFMFTDIVSSTNLAQALGDEAWGHLLEWHDKTLRGSFLAHGGEEVKQVGDGFFVAFDRPCDAIECAVAIQRTLADHRRAHGFSPIVRIGLHCGEVTRRDRDYEGMQVHQAARIVDLAGGDEIVSSKDVYAGEDCRYSVSRAQKVALKGIAEPVEVGSIDWR